VFSYVLKWIESF